MALKITHQIRGNPGSASTADSSLPNPLDEIPAQTWERAVFYVYVSAFTVATDVTFKIEEGDESGLGAGAGGAELWHEIAAFAAITAIGKYRLVVNPILGNRLRVNRDHNGAGSITYTMHAVATIL